MKYFLIAGEASGDMHASRLMAQIKAGDPQAQFRFLGGDLMAREAGRSPEIHYREMAFMGLADVIAHLPAIRRNFRRAKEAIAAFDPDVFVAVDYPGFNLRMIRWAKERGYRTTYYILPKLWAWKEGRVKILRRYADRLLVILPFETDFYRKHHIRAVYVGNPTVESVDAYRPPSGEAFRLHKGPDERPLVALLPGSRRQEIRYMLPVMLEMTGRFPGLQFVIAGAPSLDEAIYRQYGWNGDIPLLWDQTYEILARSRAAVVTSGTATLETALFGVPQVVGYRTQAWQYHLGKHLVKVKYFSLVNLILDRPAVPELLQDAFKAEVIGRHLEALLQGPEREAMLAQYGELRSVLGPARASERAAEEIIALGKK